MFTQLTFTVCLIPTHTASSAGIASEDREVVEEVTRGQNTNIEWFNQRMGAITSTQTEDIRKFSAPDR